MKNINPKIYVASWAFLVAAGIIAGLRWLHPATYSPQSLAAVFAVWAILAAIILYKNISDESA